MARSLGGVDAERTARPEDHADARRRRKPRVGERGLQLCKGPQHCARPAAPGDRLDPQEPAALTEEGRAHEAHRRVPHAAVRHLLHHLLPRVVVVVEVHAQVVHAHEVHARAHLEHRRRPRILAGLRDDVVVRQPLEEAARGSLHADRGKNEPCSARCEPLEVKPCSAPTCRGLQACRRFINALINALQS